jgi:hypothetical protein
MNYRSIALAVAALSLAHITPTAAQSVYVAPGGVYIGGGPVYVTPAPSIGNGAYVEPTYGYGYGVPEPTPYLAPPVVAGAGYVVAAAPYGLNGNGYGNGYRYGNGYGCGNGYGNGYGYGAVAAPGAGYVTGAPGYGYGAPPPPAYYNGDPVLRAYGRARLSDPAPRPPAAIPYKGNGRCIAGRGYGIGRC